MNTNSENKKAVDRYQALARQRRKIMELPPEKALDAILDAPQPAALVHSFPEEDFFFLINDIGLENSLELMKLASNRQWEYILDIEVWEKDRIEMQSVTRWLDLLLKLDSQRFIKWFLDEKTELVEFYLFKNTEVKVRESEQDPSEFDKGFYTFDDTVYFRFKDDVFDADDNEEESDSTLRKHRDAFLSNFFRLLADYDHIIYQKVLLESSSVIPAEVEEETYRLRNVRLAEKGFVPFDEAVGIYQALKPQDLKKQSVKYTVKEDERKQLLPVPLYHAGMLEKDNFFTKALKHVEMNEVLEQIQSEFAGLCNQIVSADQEAIRDREALGAIVKKACGYLSLGLEVLAAEGAAVDIHRATALIKKYPLINIFRVGYGLALELKWKAERWRKTSWFEKQGLLLSFWDQDGMGALGGLFIKKPMFYDNYATGVLYREFTSAEDVKKTEKILNEIICLDELLALMTVKPEKTSDAFLTYKNFLLTLWVRSYLGLVLKPAPLALDEFKRFFGDLFNAKGKPRKTRPKMKEAFLQLLSDMTGQTPYDISQKLGQTLENLFIEIESELGEVSSTDLVPEYIHLFLIKS